MNNCNRFSAFFLTVLLLTLPFAPVYAQTDADAPTTDTALTSVVADIQQETIPVDTLVQSQDSTEAPSVQDTFDSQKAVLGDALESTTNPETTMTTDSDVLVIPLVETEAATTQESISLEVAPTESTGSEEVAIEDLETLDVVAEVTADEAQTPLSDESIPANESATRNENQTPVSLAELEPEAEYVFALSGKSIPTKSKVKRADGKEMREETVVTALAPVIDNVHGTVSVSGECANVYYVVLLYKNATDYDANPSSYIVNRAYPCENGSYSYAIDELPSSLANGIYYLLVGEQGERGSWSPITGLTEISINRN